MSNDATRLFGLGEVEVVGVEVADDDIGASPALRVTRLRS